MSEKYIRDRTGKILGCVEGDYIRDRGGRILGKYNTSDGWTRDRTGKIVGQGDQRMRLLPKP